MNQFAPTVNIYTLGCKVNQYESEAIGEALAARGFDVRESEDTVCDFYIINTCTVTAESDRKARQFIRRALSHNPDAFILVTGCLAQVDADSIRTIEGVDYVCGNKNKLDIVNAAVALRERGVKASAPTLSVDALDDATFESMSIRHFARTRAYIKIEDGCENHCTYCIIPAARGQVRSKPLADVVREVRALTESGCREVVLTGIETASWGRDFRRGANTEADATPAPTLADLLTAVDAIDDIGRVRLGSLDPSLMRPAFVEKIAPLASLAPHFHLSMQSGSDRILARMKRKYNRTQALEAIKRVRAALPQVQFTTDMIVGFPGETDEDFEATLDFARRARFLAIHVFPYSRRAGTPAAAMPDQVPAATKRERAAALSALAAAIRREILTDFAAQGTVRPVLFETWTDGVATGHTPEFIEVRAPAPHSLHAVTREVCLNGVSEDGEACHGTLIDPL